MRVGLLVVVVAGCYSPTIAPGSPCDPGRDSCAGALVCTAGAAGYSCQPSGAAQGDAGRDAPGIDGAFVDARIDASGTGDLDGDGVIDAIDNCPTVANANQDNEDGDAYGDVCDPCPPFADGAAPDDPDGDGVSGLCDPRPQVAGDQIVLFDGFHRALSATWVQYGTWTQASDAVSASVLEGAHASLHLPDPGMASETVMTGLVVTADHHTTTYAGAGTLTLHQAMTDSAVMCGVGINPPSAGQVGLIDTTAESLLASMDITFAVGTSYVITQHRDSTSQICSERDGVTVASVSATSALAPTLPEVGVRVHGVAATFDWFLVTTHP